MIKAPPIPCTQASECRMHDGCLYDRRFKLIPAWALSTNHNHNWRSLHWSYVSLMWRWWLAAYCAAKEMMGQWDDDSTMIEVTDEFFQFLECCLYIAWIIAVHALCLLFGSSIVKWRVSTTQPNTIFCLLGVALAINSLMDNKWSPARLSSGCTDWPKRKKINGTIRAPCATCHSRKAAKMLSM